MVLFPKYKVPYPTWYFFPLVLFPSILKYTPRLMVILIELNLNIPSLRMRCCSLHRAWVSLHKELFFKNTIRNHLHCYIQHDELL